MQNNLIDTIHSILDIGLHQSRADFLQSIAKKIFKEIPAKYIVIGHIIPGEKAKIKTDVFLDNGLETGNITFTIKDTPCEKIILHRKVCLYPKDVSNLFPDHLIKKNVESYVGAPILTSNNKLQGLLFLMDVQPIKAQKLMSSLCEFLASRIGAELELFQSASDHREGIALKNREQTAANTRLGGSKLERLNKELKREIKHQAILLEEKNKKLEDTVVALRVLLEQNKIIEQNISRTIKFNLEKIILPNLEKLRDQLDNNEHQALCQIITTNLIDITRPLLPATKSSLLNKLSPSELRVANLIKQGNNTKDIGQVLNLSTQTIATHRCNIRKKLGLTNQKENLFSVLNQS
ncbi:MAG: LuxR C-terminal-related transcriptional regulator [Thermodesulfobacteriota bacterium]